MNYRRLLFRLRRGMHVPPQVVAFKIRQESQLAWLRRTGGWQRIERKAAHGWDDASCKQFIAQPSVVFAPDAVETLKRNFQDGSIDCSAFEMQAKNFRERKFSLLGAAVPFGEAWPWHSDWQHENTWHPAHFRTYEFYFHNRDRPCDVKYPWELSRLGFSLPLVQQAVIKSDPADAALALQWIRDWEQSNPLARSVAWFPMEASIRGLNLIFILEMLRSSDLTALLPTSDVEMLLRLITMHAEFVCRALEYTDVRGNHYAANIAFLAICGAVLRDWYSPAKTWFSKFAAAIDGEIEKQFLPDGVNFEKSIAYHRLVGELFLVSAIVLRRVEQPLSDGAEARLKQACEYTAAYTRPDGLSPNVGDNDDARLLQFDPVPLRDHSPLVNLGERYFQARTLPPSHGLRAATLWLLGDQAARRRGSLRFSSTAHSNHFKAGGVVTAKQNDNFLWMDVGEVGLAGTGGHGHNDLLSFELCLEGQPLIVDPGSYVYTGDPKARDLFRSSAYHNGLIVDGEEIARLGTMWQIHNDARPESVHVSTVDDVTTVRAAHTGYRRLQPSIEHMREVVFDARRGMLQCTDTVEGEGEHAVERFLHLDPKVSVELIGDNAVMLQTQDHMWQVICDRDATIHCEPGWVSPGYGVRVESTTLRITNRICDRAVLSMAVAPPKHPFAQSSNSTGVHAPEPMSSSLAPS